MLLRVVLLEIDMSFFPSSLPPPDFNYAPLTLKKKKLCPSLPKDNYRRKDA